jgi:hypothetical protein
MPFALSKLKRPKPPEELLEVNERSLFRPSSELALWAEEIFITEGSKLHNPEHSHLRMATLGFLWTNLSITRQMNRVVGMAELTKPHPALGKWQKARIEYQLAGWFEDVPDFLITLDAKYAATCDNANFCSLVEHELYHCALKGFTMKGAPIWAIKGHDVEEHVGIVARYGAGNAAGDTMRLVEAAKKPLIARAQIDWACGTKDCMPLAA